MKKWVWVVVLAAGGFFYGQFQEKDAAEYNEYDLDICYVQTPGSSEFSGGEVIITKPAGSDWTDVEQGKTPCPNGLRFSLFTTSQISEALSNLVTSKPREYVVDCITAPTGIEYAGP